MVYTPRALATFIVDRVLEARGGRLDGAWLDPACGDGALLTALIDRVAAAMAPGEIARFVEQSVFGIDIDPTACGEARNRIVAAVESRCGPQPASYMQENLRVADFLALDPARERRWDVIVANPPYVSAVHLDGYRKQRYATKFGSAWGRLDLYGLFLEQSLELLRSGGHLSFITPDKWLTADSSRRLRALVRRSHGLRSIDRFERHDLFPGVAIVPCVFVIAAGEQCSEAALRWWDIDPAGVPRARGASEPMRLAADGEPWYPPLRGVGESATLPLGALVERISVGLATGLNACFVVGPEVASTIEPELLRPVLRGRDIRAGTIADSEKWLVLPYEFDEDGEAARLVDLDRYPGAYAHLESYRSALENRHCVRVWGKQWYDLHDPVLSDVSRRPKIVLPDVAYEPRFVLELGDRMPLHSAYYMLPRIAGPLSPEQLLAALRTPTVTAELRRIAPTAKSGYRRFRAGVLRALAVPLRDGEFARHRLADAA